MFGLPSRFCPGCGADVEDVGGFCLLGHALGSSPSYMTDIQEQISTAFDVAQSQIENSLRLTAVTTPLPSGDLPMGDRYSSAPVTDPVVTPPAVAEVPVTPVPPPPPISPAMTPPPVAPAPAVPAAPATRAPNDSMADPITSFAPAPSMDWGPEEGPRRPLRRRTRRGA